MICEQDVTQECDDATMAISNRVLKTLYGESAGQCAFPDCPFPHSLDDGTPLVEVAHIKSLTPSGPRSDLRMSQSEVNNLDNLILLCPTHHREIDEFPTLYTVERLQHMRQSHSGKVTSGLYLNPPENPQASGSKLEEALALWRSSRENNVEEFWQSLFTQRPELLVPAVHGQPFTLQSKCYVGGKSIDNSGGNILDFLAQHNGDVAIIEIKAPTTALLGSRYRNNVYPPSRELAGAITQALSYRQSLQNELYNLRYRSPDLVVHNPEMFILIGDIERQRLTGAQQNSFELFRRSLKDVSIISYDELFNALAYLAVWLT